jgi:hypothetical protein
MTMAALAPFSTVAAGSSELPSFPRRAGLRSPAAIAAVGFVLSLTATLRAWHRQPVDEERDHTHTLNGLALRYQRNLREQLDSYAAVLRGAAGLCAATSQLSRSQWHDYAAQPNLPRNYPGFVGTRADITERREAVEIVVSDEGVGIPEGELEAVFDKFVQSSKTRSGAGGTGLGLAICREIVAAHGGEIFARNNAAGGTDVVVRLPAAAAGGSAANEGEGRRQA